MLNPTAPDFVLLLTEISHKAGRSANQCHRIADMKQKPVNKCVQNVIKLNFFLLTLRHDIIRTVRHVLGGEVSDL